MLAFRMPNRVNDLLGAEWVRALIEAVGGVSLVFSSYASVAFHIYLGTMSAVGATCGAILGVHAVCRLVLPICRRNLRTTPKIHEVHDNDLS